MFSEELKIPRERVAVLIGKKGSDKRKIEKKTHCCLSINSKEGDVVITGEDSLDVYMTKKVVMSISRGFNPDIALELLDENNCLEYINIVDFSGKSKKKLERLRSRVIGTKGKTRRIIENLTNTKISIYGKTICIIGSMVDVSTAKRAIESLLQGAPHGPVYKFLYESKKKNDNVISA